MTPGAFLTAAAEVERLAIRAKRAAYGDSSDREIERLQEALSASLSLLGIEEWRLDEQAHDEFTQAELE